jgi:hypothetical protein
MTLLYRLSIFLLLFTAACEGFSDPKEEAKPKENSAPTTPSISLSVSDADGVYRLSASIVSASTDPDGDEIGYRYTWYRNGELQSVPFSQTEVTEAAVARRYEVTWSVMVTPFDNQLDGTSAQAERALLICAATPEPNTPSMQLVDCLDRFAYSATVTQDVAPLSAGELRQAIENALRDNLLAASGDLPKKERFTNFLDLTFKQMFDSNTSTTVAYDLQTYRYLPVTGATGPFGEGGYEPYAFADQHCIDVPLVGSPCIHGYLVDIDAESGARLFDYDVTQAVYQVYALPPLNGIARYAADVTIYNARFDYLYQPPGDVSVVPGDVKNDGADYEPSGDLSAYVKAHGRAVYDKLSLRFVVLLADATPTSIRFDLEQLALAEPALDLTAGPFCNNNLGTTSADFADVTLRPFSPTGLVNFAGLVSDTSTNANPGTPVDTYYSLVLSGYPAIGSNMNNSSGTYSGGGSGTGRDRLGLEAIPYSYGISDHPENCKVPADACASTSAPVQTGGPDAAAGCELPNVSNDSDDATYRVTTDFIGQTMFIGPGSSSVLRDASYLGR